jgi:hypothetical protein
MEEDRSQFSNRLAFALLVAALLCMVGFHPAPIAHIPLGDEVYTARGWEFWSTWWGLLRNLDFSFLVSGMPISAAGQLIWIFVALISPFLFGPLRKSRILWWITTFLSAFGLSALTGLQIYEFLMNPPSMRQLQVGVYLAMASQILNFAGLLFIRRNEPATSALST